MAVIRGESYLWKHPVPYESSTNEVVNKSIQTLNDAAGFGLFVPYTGQQDQADHVQFHVDTEQACSHIGCAFKGLQTINLKASSDLFSCLHEIMHCLGFEHEQFHAKYAWNAADTPKKNPFYKVNEEVSVAQAASVRMNVDTSNWNPQKKTANWGEEGTKAKASVDVEMPAKQLKPKEPELPFIFKTGSVNQIIYQFLAKAQNPAYAESYWEQVAKKNTSVLSVTPLCDYDSIMMYGEFERAAKFAASKGQQISIEHSGKRADNCLSNLDVDTLQKLYGKFKS